MTLRLDPALAGRIQAVLLDIEGTTTSIDFVYQTLFPYARRHMAEFVERHYETEDLRSNLEQLRREWETDARPNSECPAWRAETHQAEIESVIAYVHWLMDRDRKSHPLKWLQGRIWESGYQTGELRGHVYPDVPIAFERWQRKGKTISIFSSGSVLAQKLLFAHTTAGDLTPFIRAYFDTTTGGKSDPESYKKIAAALGLAPAAILFLSDSVAELNAARSTGMETVLSARPENPPTGPHSHRVIRCFDEVFP